MGFSWQGKFRVYFNTKGDFPRLWSVDGGGGAEVLVSLVRLNGVAVKTGFDLSAQWPNPKGWIEGEGIVSFAGDVAEINPRSPQKS